MKRYNLEDVTVCGEPWREMIEATDGEWLCREDVLSLLKSLVGLIEDEVLEETIAELEK